MLERLPVGVTHHTAARDLFCGPRGWKATGHLRVFQGQPQTILGWVLFAIRGSRWTLALARREIVCLLSPIPLVHHTFLAHKRALLSWGQRLAIGPNVGHMARAAVREVDLYKAGLARRK